MVMDIDFPEIEHEMPDREFLMLAEVGMKHANILIGVTTFPVIGIGLSVIGCCLSAIDLQLSVVSFELLKPITDK